MLRQQPVYQFPVPDVPPHEDVIWVAGDGGQGPRVPGVGQGVQVDDPEPPDGLEDEVPPDKPGAAGDEHGTFVVVQNSSFQLVSTSASQLVSFIADWPTG